MKKSGIIGCGNIAKVHGWVLQGMEDVELAAVCDLDVKKAENVAEQYGNDKTQVYADWLQVCDSDLDVIHICTPHFLHVPMAVEALKQGKAVFMEKPCAISRKQFAELEQADMKTPGKLGFCFQNRYNETTQVIEKMVQEGMIGVVKGARAFVTWRRDADYYETSDWKGEWFTEGGGVLINQSIHTLDLLLRFLGTPQQVCATISNHHLKETIQVEDTVEAWMTFSENRRACFYASNGYVADAPVILELEGEHGRITMNGSEVTVCTSKTGSQHMIYENKSGIGKSYWGCGHKTCIMDFYECLESKKRFSANLRGVEKTFDTMMKIYEAAYIKKEIL